MGSHDIHYLGRLRLVDAYIYIYNVYILYSLARVGAALLSAVVQFPPITVDRTHHPPPLPPQLLPPSPWGFWGLVVVGARFSQRIS